MKKKLQIGLIIFILGAAYAAYDIYQFRDEVLPRLEAEKQKKDAELAAKNSELKRLQSFSENIENIKKELKELNLQLEAGLEYLPRTFNLTQLLRKMTLIAQNSGIEIVSFKPKKNEEKTNQNFLSSIGLECELRGSFSQTLVFVDQLSRLRRVINMETLKMKPLETTTSRSGGVLVSSVANLRTFRFSE